MHIQCLPILWDMCHWCSCGFCEVHYRQINKHTHTKEREHRKHTQRGPGCRAISPPGVLRSIDPAWLLSAGYVSSTAALPVRGRARAVEGVREVEINGEIGGPARRGWESGEKERTQGWCHGGNGMKHEKQKRSVVARMQPTHWLQIWTGSEVKWGCLSDVTLHHSSQGEGSVVSLLLHLILSPLLLLTVRLFSGCCLLTSCVSPISL